MKNIMLKDVVTVFNFSKKDSINELVLIRNLKNGVLLVVLLKAFFSLESLFKANLQAF